MKQKALKAVSAALVFATVLSAAACNKKDNKDNGGGTSGLPETVSRGQKIAADSPWYESTSTTFTPTVETTKKIQSLGSTFAGADDKYIIVSSTGNYQIPENMDWSKYNSKEYEIALLTVVDRNTKQVVNSIDLTKNYTESSYVGRIDYSNGKINATITNYDPVNNISTSTEYAYDPATGNELGKREIAASNSGGKTVKVDDYSVSLIMQWVDFGYFTIVIDSPDGGTASVDLMKSGKNIYDIPTVLSLGDGKALLPVSVENEQCFYELDLKSATVTELDAKEYSWLNPDYLYSAYAAKDGMIYYMTPVDIARIDMKNKKIEEAFNYSWCGENRNLLNYLTLADCTEDSFLLCGGSGYGTAYTPTNISDFTIVELTKAKENPNAGKTIMELYVPYGYVNEKVADAINKFNKENADYFIQVSGRYTDDDAYNAGAQATNEDEMQTANLNGDAKISNKLAMDILNGEGPDILMNVANFGQLNSSNYLVDLTKYVGTIDNEKYFTNIVEASKVNGQLYQLTLCYGIEGIQTDKKYAGASGVGFTTAEYKKFLNEQLNGKDVINSGQAVYFTKLFNAMSDKFIVNGKADFSGPEFAAIAEFVKENVQAQAKSWNDPTYTGGVGAMIFKGDSSVSNGQPAIYTTCYGTGTYLFNMMDLNGGSAVLGIPSADGRGPLFSPHVSIAISAQAINADACGEFVKLLMSEEVQESLAMNDEFVLSRTAFRKISKMAVDYYNGEGRQYVFGIADSNNGKGIKFSQENIDEMEKIISSCTRSNTSDAAIDLILIEEMPAYFLGQKDLNSVIAIAQDRVQKVLSERG